eukprot:6076091-Prymnesium_polylepis.2
MPPLHLCWQVGAPETDPDPEPDPDPIAWYSAGAAAPSSTEVLFISLMVAAAEPQDAKLKEWTSAVISQQVQWHELGNEWKPPTATEDARWAQRNQGGIVRTLFDSALHRQNSLLQAVRQVMEEWDGEGAAKLQMTDLHKYVQYLTRATKPLLRSLQANV